MKKRNKEGGWGERESMAVGSKQEENLIDLCYEIAFLTNLTNRE